MSASVSNSFNEIKHVFGLNNLSGQNNYLMEDGNIVFTAGTRLIVYSPETKQQQTIAVSDNPMAKITALGASSGKTAAIIICAMWHENKTYLQSFEYPSMKRQKPYHFKQEDENMMVNCINLSNNGKYAATTQANTCNMTYWNLEKGKPIASVQLAQFLNYEAHQMQVSICPIDETKLLAYGKGFVKMFKWADGQFKSMQYKVENKNFHCVMWNSADKAYFGCDDSTIAIVESGFAMHEIKLGTEKPVSIKSFTRSSNGIICGCENGQVIAITQKATLNSDAFQLVKTVPLDKEGSIKGITSVTMSQNEEYILVSTSDKRIFSLSFGSMDAFQDEECRITQPMPALHASKVVVAETCAWKQLMATAGADQSIRIWNYAENTCDLVKCFNEEIVAMSFHFTGLYMVVAFKESVHLFSVLADDLKAIAELNMKNVNFLKFSRGGHYFAAAQGNQIHVYDTWTKQLVATLAGHRSKINYMEWDAMDYRLISSGEGGEIYHWSMISMKKEAEYISKSFGYKKAVTGPTAEPVIAITAEKNLQMIDKDGAFDLLENNIVTDAIISRNEPKKIYVATETGSVILLDLAQIRKGVIETFSLHNQPITALNMTSDGRQLLITDNEGSVTILSLIIGKETHVEDPVYLEEVFVGKTDLDQKINKINELKNDAEELRLENEYQLHIKEMNFQDKLKELKTSHEYDIMEFQKKNQKISHEIESEQQKYELDKREIEEQHKRDLEDLEALFTERLNVEVQNQNEVVEKLNLLENNWRKQLQALEDSFQTTKRAKETDLTMLLEEKNKELTRLQDELAKQSREHDELVREIEEDSEDLIAKMRLKHENKLKEERDNGLKIKAENSMMKKKHGTLLHEIELLNSDIQKLQSEERKLQSNMKMLEKDINGLKREIHERDDSIQDKEKRIDDLKKKNQELEKFKFVLDYKMKELKEQIEPREQEIQDLIKQIKEMDMELEKYHQSNNALDLKAQDLKQRVHASEVEVQKQKVALALMDKEKKAFEYELSNCMSYIYDAKLFKQTFMTLYQKYGGANEDQQQHQIENASKSTTKIIKLESLKQREMLEKNLKSLRDKLEREKVKHKTDKARIVKENMLLINEINDMRKEIKAKKMYKLFS